MSENGKNGKGARPTTVRESPPPAAPIVPRVLSADQAATYLGISYRVLVYYANNNKIPRLTYPTSVADGKQDDMRKLLFDRSDLDAFIEASKGGER